MMTTTKSPARPVRCRLAIPAFGYDNPRAAIAWLVRAFGAEPRTIIETPSGGIGHAEVWMGDACIMLGSLDATPTPPTVGGQGAAYVVVSTAAEVDDLYARATASGATVAKALSNTPYGSREFGVLDPEGNYWAFGTYVPS
ncbi:MAG TPA: VOC family protein [Gemmatimonadaceae bacterium]